MLIGILFARHSFVHKKHAWRIAISVCSYLCHIVCAQNSTRWKGCVFCMDRVHLFNELNLRKRAPLKQVGVGNQEPLGSRLQHVFRELGSSCSGCFERWTLAKPVISTKSWLQTSRRCGRRFFVLREGSQERLSDVFGALTGPSSAFALRCVWCLAAFVTVCLAV